MEIIFFGAVAFLFVSMAIGILALAFVYALMEYKVYFND